MNLYVYISLGIAGIGYFLSGRSSCESAEAPHIHLPLPISTHDELMGLEHSDIDFTRLETAYLLRPRQKYHQNVLLHQRRLSFARYLVEHGCLSEEVA